MRDLTYYVKNELLQVSMEPGYVDKFDIELWKSSQEWAHIYNWKDIWSWPPHFLQPIVKEQKMPQMDSSRLWNSDNWANTSISKCLLLCPWSSFICIWIVEEIDKCHSLFLRYLIWVQGLLCEKGKIRNKADLKHKCQQLTMKYKKEKKRKPKQTEYQVWDGWTDKANTKKMLIVEFRWWTYVCYIYIVILL